MPHVIFCLMLSLVFAGATRAADSSANAPVTNTIAVSIRVDATQTKGELRPIWRFFGADEPNYATMKNGKKLLAELGALASKRVYFRAHNLLTSGDGTPALKWAPPALTVRTRK